MADLTSPDRPVDPTNGAVEGMRKGIASGAIEDHRTLADRDQDLADADQTVGDSDQTAADSDQTAADRDQTAADSDQAASDRDLMHGGDPVAHEVARDLRDRSTHQRRQSAHQRVEAAAVRDAVAQARDLAASARDQAAELRDRELATRDVAQEALGRAKTGAEIVMRAAANRRRAAADRAAAAEGRTRAAADREQAARDRELAAHDRSQARADRDALLDQLAIADTDQLTGTRTRGAGLTDLGHEVDRANRTSGLLVVAYVDIVGLKAVNDAHGHSAGDALLQRAVRGIRCRLRSYDLIVRVGGDEFVCVMPDARIEDARQRFAEIETALKEHADPCEIRIGFAALAPEDSPTELIQRADAELPTSVRR